MHDVRASVGYANQTFPDGTPAITSYVFELRNSAGAILQTQTFGSPGPALVEFLNPTPGIGYTVRGYQRGSTGQTLGTAIDSASFDVSADVVLIVVSGITVQVVQG